MKWFYIVSITGFFLLIVPFSASAQEGPRPRDLGMVTGTLPTGLRNAITDVPGVRVGHTTLVKGDSVRTGVTAILPHGENLFMEKVPAAIQVFNGFGKLAGYTQVKELGNLETPVILTNTLSVGTAVTAVVEYTLRQPGNEEVRSVNAVVGETNDGYLNDIRGLHVSREDVWQAISGAAGGPVEEGCVGAGTGTRALGYKGGIGTASRQVRLGDSLYTVGVLVQTNFGNELVMLGVPVGRELRQQRMEEDRGGSCMIVVATDAPLPARNLERLAHRAFIGMGRTTTHTSNGSGDYAIAFSTAYRIPHGGTNPTYPLPPLVKNDRMTLLFRAVEEATEEAVYNSLFKAVATTGRNGNRVEAIPVQRVLEIMKKYGR
ncbi:MAG TPA: S58 family peptidase [Bacteroidetes bacterium]|nr:S58 family peptidase [Bacteroidota bacterium]